MKPQAHDPIPALLALLQPARIRRDVYCLASNPLPMRKANLTLPGHAKSTLDEADDYVTAELAAAGYGVEREACQVQAFRRDTRKPIQHQYASPAPEDPWYTAYNLYTERRGAAQPEEIVLLVAHKDSQSWIDSPGAYDNAVGTVVNLELARVLAETRPARTVRWLFCNEEHTPWTSVTAARLARERGDNLVAIFNTDSVGGKSAESLAAGLCTNVTRYTTLEGRWLAELMAEVNEMYHIGLTQSAYESDRPSDDDGSFIKEGFLSAVTNVGSLPYVDPNYHQLGDTPESVDLENVVRAARAILAAVLRVAR